MPDMPRQTGTRDALLLTEVAFNPSVDKAVAAVREFLGMDVAFATQFVGEMQVFEAVAGDGSSFGLHEGAALPSEDLYCRRVLAGELPRTLADVRGDHVAAAMPVTDAADVGAFVSVPINFSNSESYGTLCAASHATEPLLADRDVGFLQVIARLIADQLERERLAELTRSRQLQAAAVTTLSAALAARDGYTGDHSEAVVNLAVAVAKRMRLDEAQIADVEHAARLHDLGKIAIPDRILHKAGPLDDHEWDIMRQHPIYGDKLIADVAVLEHLAPVLRAEHQRWDGGGYPDGLAGNEIPLASRIAFVCDAYHAMTSDRPYRRSLGHHAAIAEIAKQAGKQFCPTSSRALLKVLSDETDNLDASDPLPAAAPPFEATAAR